MAPTSSPPTGSASSTSLVSLLTQVLMYLQAFLNASGSASTATALTPNVIAQFQNETWVENLAVRCNGKILATTVLPSAAVYQIDPSTPGKQPQLVANLSEIAPGTTSAFGIAEYQPDLFAVVASNFSISSLSGQLGSNALWKLDMPAFDSGKSGKEIVTKLAAVPEALVLNGIASSTSNGSKLLVCDSAGFVFSVDTQSGQATTVLNATNGTPQLAASNSSNIKLGPNGLKVQNGTMFLTNTNTQELLRFPLGPDGLPSSKTPETYANFSTFVDDFAFAEDGTAFVATNAANSLDSVSTTGQISQIVGGLNSSQIVGGTAVRFGRTDKDAHTLYVSTNGGLGAPLNGTFIQGGQIVAVQTNKQAAKGL